MIGSGCMCLSHYFGDIEKEFEPGKHLDVWNTMDELFERIDYYLENDKERNKIAVAGSNHVHTNHTWINRMSDLTQIIEKYKS